MEFRNLYWQKFRSLYMVLKRSKTNKDRWVSCDSLGPDYDEKIVHFPTTTYKASEHMGSSDKETLENSLMDSIADIGVCEAQVPYWREQLALCDKILLDTFKMDSIVDGFLQVCKDAQTAGNALNLFGANEIADPFKPSKPEFGSFEDVLDSFLGVGYESKYCNLALLNLPKGPAHDYFNEKLRDVSDCHCEGLKEEARIFTGCSDDKAYITSDGEALVELFNDLATRNYIQNESQSDNLFDVYYNGQFDELADLFKGKIGGQMDEAQDTLYFRSELVSGVPNEMWLHFAWESQNHRDQNNSKCNFRLLLPNGYNFGQINSFIDIKPTDNQYFGAALRFLVGIDTIEMLVNSPCVTPYEKCNFDWGSILDEMSLQNFLSHYNKKYGSNINIAKMKLLFGECGAGGGGAGCSPYIHPKEYEIMHTFNEMMRESQILLEEVKDILPMKNTKTLVV